MTVQLLFIASPVFVTMSGVSRRQTMTSTGLGIAYPASQPQGRQVTVWYFGGEKYHVVFYLSISPWLFPYLFSPLSSDSLSFPG